MRPAAALIVLKPALTAIIAGGLAGLVAILTFQLMMGAQHLIWETGAPVDGPGPVRIVVTILIGERCSSCSRGSARRRPSMSCSTTPTSRGCSPGRRSC